MPKKIRDLLNRFRTQNPRQRKILTAAAAVCLAVVLHYAWLGFTRVSTDDAFIENRVTSVSPKVAAHVLKVYVNDNQEVRAGDLLVELDARDFAASLDMAKAALAAARAEAHYAHKDADRYARLAQTDEVSKQQYEMAVLRAEIADAKARQAEAQVRQGELQLSYSKIYAPASGYVTRKHAEPGAFVQPGQGLLALVSHEPWVVANFKETQLARMRPGQKVRIRIDTYGGKVFKGRVDSIQRGTGSRFSLFPPENATGNFVKVVQRVPVKILFEEPPDSRYPLSAGMSVVPEVKVR